MTLIAARYDLVIPQRATLREGPIWLPIDGRGCSFVAQVYADEKRKRKLLDLTVEVVDPFLVGADPEFPDSIECELMLTAPWEQTRLVDRDGFWDLLVIYPPDGEERDYYLQGLATLDRGVSEAAP